MVSVQRPISFQIELPLTIRQATYTDLKELEWNGEFIHLRNLFQRSFHEQQKGSRLMLVVDCNGNLVGRLFIVFKGKNPKLANGETCAYLYSFQVMEMFQNRGIGTRLLDEAESMLREGNFQKVTISVAKTNHLALRLYDRRGYKIFAENSGKWRYLDHRGKIQQVDEPAWLLEKSL